MPSRTAFVSICSNNYLAQASVFFATARDHHPEAALVLGLADRRDPALRYPEGVEVIEAEALGIPDFASFAFAYDMMEFNTAIKPSLMLRLFERGHRNVVYFDPDIEIHRRLDDLLALLDGGASFVLTPHFCDPPALGGVRTERHIMQTGVYNLGFLGAAATPETEPALRWWSRMLRHGCIDEQHHGLFVDQKYMDLLPGLASRAHVLRDTGFNVAYWNLDRRRVSAGPDGRWQVDGRPLAFFHFSGFAPERPDEVSKYAPSFSATGALKALLAAHAGRRRAAAVAVGQPSAPYGYGHFRSGVPIPGLVRRMFRDKHLTWTGDPFATYDRYARLPHPASPTGVGGEVVTNLMQHHHDRDVNRYDLGHPAGVAAFARAFVDAAAERGVDERLWKAVA